MKLIEISDEMYDKLISLATEMTTQDPRGTKMPHMFQIRDWKKQYDWGLNGDNRIWVGDYQEEIETLDEFKEYLESNGIDIPENLEEMWGWDYEIVDWIEEHCPHLRQCSYSMVPEYTNHFLTAKAGEEHLRLNYYHYHKDADVYLKHAWRNPEMEMLSEFLCGLVGKELYT